MKRRYDLVLRSLGSEYMSEPDSKDLAEWISGQRGSRCDLVSYNIEKSLLAQKKVDIPCTGGLYYSARVTESIGEIKSGCLCSEPYPVPDDISLDAQRVRKLRKGCYMALPAPSSLLIQDYYFNDHAEFVSAICEVYGKMMREQRDRGIKGHIVISDRFSEVELEELSDPKSFFFSPLGGSKAISSILEYQQDIAVFPEKLDVLFEIMPEYEIDSVTVVDPGESDYERVLSEFDPDSVISGGYCRGCGTDYWENLKERSYVVA